MTEPTLLEQLLALATSHGGLGIVAIVVVYARKVLSPASGFPVTVSPRWLPIVSALGGLALGAVDGLQTGQRWPSVLLGAAIGAGSTGFADSLLTAIFDHDNAPKWARALVFVFDDITGHGAPKARLTGGEAFGAPNVVKVEPIAAPPPVAPPADPTAH
jgi:hypothetical protein